MRGHGPKRLGKNKVEIFFNYLGVGLLEEAAICNLKAVDDDKDTRNPNREA